MYNIPIFCFTYAGGTKDFYNIFDGLLSNITLIKLEYSGHGTRHNEMLNKSFDEVVEDLYPRIRDYIIENNVTVYGLMGYSMGSIVAFAMLQYILDKDEILMPKHVFFAAHEPMAKIEGINTNENVDEYIKRRTLEFGAVPQKLVNNSTFWRMYLPIFKSDYLMIEKYNFEGISFLTDVPLTVFFSSQDTKYEDIIKWKKYFMQSKDYIEYEGMHFFIKDYYKEMAEVIKDRMECHI